MDPSTMLRAFCDAVEQRNGKAFAGTVHRGRRLSRRVLRRVRGPRKDRRDDRRLVLSHGHRFSLGHARPVSDGKTLYARYTFSYRSTLPEAEGARAMFEGVSIMQLRDGKIAEYHEVANTAPAFVDIKFAPERIAKIVAKQGAALKARPEMKRHLVE